MQEALLLSRAQSQTVSLDVVENRRDFLGAINLCVDLSGLEDKEIYLALGIDAGQWSRIRKGDAHFPPNKLGDLMDLCDNEVPLEWLALSRGKGIHQLETETQRQLRISNEALAEERKKTQLLTDLLKGKST